MTYHNVHVFPHLRFAELPTIHLTLPGLAYHNSPLQNMQDDPSFVFRNTIFHLIQQNVSAWRSSWW